MNKEEIEPYIKNIEILDVNIVADFFGEKLILKIIDNNNKFFKTRKVKELYLEITDLDNAIKNTLERYIWTKRKYDILWDRHQKMIKEWKKKNA
mgnify:FL=1